LKPGSSKDHSSTVRVGLHLAHGKLGLMSAVSDAAFQPFDRETRIKQRDSTDRWRLGRGVLFFLAEDGIRDATVTGVQTCALPISSLPMGARRQWQLPLYIRQLRSVLRQDCGRTARPPDRRGAPRRRAAQMARRYPAHARRGPIDRKSVV